MQENYTNVIKKIRRAKRRKQVVDALMEFLFLLCMIPLAGLVLFALDYLTDFPFWLRLGFTGALVLFFLGFIPWTRRSKKRVQDHSSAAEFEEIALLHRPKGFEAMLISSVEFGSGINSTGSEALREKVIRDAAHSSYDPGTLPLYNRTGIRRALFAAALLVLIYGAWAVLDMEMLTTFAGRALGKNWKYRTATRILGVHAPTFVEQFSPVEISVRAGGILPGSGKIKVRFAGENSYYIPLEQDPEQSRGYYRAVVSEPAESFRYTVYLGDDQEGPFEMPVYRPPSLQSGVIAITPPDYTKRKPYDVPSGPVEAPRKSKLSFQFKTGGSPIECVLVLDREKRLHGKKTGEPDVWSFEPVLLEQSMAWHLELKDAHGLMNRDRIEYSAIAIPDRQPEVLVDRPKTGSYYAPTTPIRYRVRLSDDYGLRNMSAGYTVTKKVQKGEYLETVNVRNGVLQFREWNCEGKEEQVFSGLIDNATTMKLQPGESAVLTFQASDMNPDHAFQGGLAQPVEIHMVTADELRKLIREEELQIHQFLQDITDNMKRQRELLENVNKRTRTP